MGELIILEVESAKSRVEYINNLLHTLRLFLFYFHEIRAL
jgi:hypothetical protein